jgi:hypothetical protein
MRITLSERMFNEKVRQLQNLGPEVTSEEISHNLRRYAAKFFEYLSHFGLVDIGLVSMEGSLGHFYIGLKPCHDDESRNKRIEGLALLEPLSVTLEERDLPAFFTGMILTLMADNFNTYAAEFQRITVADLDSKLVEVATKVFASPMPTPFVIETENDAALLQELQDEEFDMFCLRSGVKVPGAERRKRDDAEQAELARIEAARQKATDDWYHGRG